MISVKNERPSVVIPFINLLQKGALITVSTYTTTETFIVRVYFMCIVYCKYTLYTYERTMGLTVQGLNVPYRTHYASEFLSKLFMFKYLSPRTVKKEDTISLIYKKIQKGSGARLTPSSYMTKYWRIFSYIRKPFLVYDFALYPIRIFLYT